MTALVIVFGVAWVLTLILFVFVVRELSWVLKTNGWLIDREALANGVMSEVMVITSVPDHGDITYKDDRLVFQNTEADTVTPLNFTTLKNQLEIMKAQETTRRAYSIKVKRSIKDLQDWEHLNPVPPPPTWFGKRIAITL